MTTEERLAAAEQRLRDESSRHPTLPISRDILLVLDELNSYRDLLDLLGECIRDNSPNIFKE